MAVRRRLGPDRPFLLVGTPRAPEGVVFRDPGAPAGCPSRVARELDRLLRADGGDPPRRGRPGDALGLPVAAVGGLVRDVLLGRVDERTDLDLVVEGSAAARSRRAVAGDLGGRTLEHPVFLTATVVLPDGGRVDLATRAARVLPGAGALPTVERASLAEDLARRDFSLNALAVRLDRAERAGSWTRPAGWRSPRPPNPRAPPAVVRGGPDAHPPRGRASPRGSGCRVDPTTRRLAAHAARLDVYRALSGDRLRAELELCWRSGARLAALGGRPARRVGPPRRQGAAGAGAHAGRRGARPRALRGLGSRRRRSPSACLRSPWEARRSKRWMERLASRRPGARRSEAPAGTPRGWSPASAECADGRRVRHTAVVCRSDPGVGARSRGDVPPRGGISTAISGAGAGSGRSRPGTTSRAGRPPGARGR